MSNWEHKGEPAVDQPVIRVVGLGGAGTNAVRFMMREGISGVDFICANTDAQHLYEEQVNQENLNLELLKLGGEKGNGLGAGARPEVGRDAAMQDRELIRDKLRGSDMVFITAGMGGGTGTGAAPVVAQIAQELGALTVAVVSKPFEYEGGKRMRVAEEGLEALSPAVNSLVTIPNQRLLDHFGHSFSVSEAFGKANEVLHGAVRGISDIATGVGFINVDFEDVRTVMSVQGKALMGSGTATGEDRAEVAIKEALECPLLEKVSVNNAGGMVVNIAVSKESFKLGELQVIGKSLDESASSDSTRVIGAQYDESLGDEIRITVVVTGIRPEGAKLQLVEAATNSPSMPLKKAVGAGRMPDRVASKVLSELPSILKKQLD